MRACALQCVLAHPLSELRSRLCATRIARTRTHSTNAHNARAHVPGDVCSSSSISRKHTRHSRMVTHGFCFRNFTHTVATTTSIPSLDPSSAAGRWQAPRRASLGLPSSPARHLLVRAPRRLNGRPHHSDLTHPPRPFRRCCRSPRDPDRATGQRRRLRTALEDRPARPTSLSAR